MATKRIIFIFNLILIKLAQECSNMTLITNDIERKKNILDYNIHSF